MMIQTKLELIDDINKLWRVHYEQNKIKNNNDNSLVTFNKPISIKSDNQWYVINGYDIDGYVWNFIVTTTDNKTWMILDNFDEHALSIIRNVLLEYNNYDKRLELITGLKDTIKNYCDSNINSNKINKNITVVKNYIINNIDIPHRDLYLQDNNGSIYMLCGFNSNCTIELSKADVETEWFDNDNKMLSFLYSPSQSPYNLNNMSYTMLQQLHNIFTKIFVTI